MTPDDAHLGSVPREIMDLNAESLREMERIDDEFASLHTVSNRAYRQYKRVRICQILSQFIYFGGYLPQTRGDSSSHAVRTSKLILSRGVRVHPLFVDDRLEDGAQRHVTVVSVLFVSLPVSECWQRSRSSNRQQRLWRLWL